MSFRWFIYYCAASAACAGYLGWAIGQLPALSGPSFLAVRGVILGLLVGAGLSLVDALWHSRSRGWAVVIARVFVGTSVAGVGGFAGGMLAGAAAVSPMFVPGWGGAGLLIGMSVGMFDFLSRLSRNEDSRGARRKLRNGLLGGVLGGLIGAGLQLALLALWRQFVGNVDSAWSPGAMGAVLLGGAIGLLVSLAIVLFKDAWVHFEAGVHAGRDLLITRPITVLGRGPGCDIFLAGDEEVELQHARIVRRSTCYILEDLDSHEGTFLNGERVIQSADLRGGDLIEIGRASLLFRQRR